MSVAEALLAPSDEERRASLRNFLMRCRSRLTPCEVGLPSTARRRVPGLRREEIAELVGVSSDWYRWFESGRPVRVSVDFVNRVADALRLERDERMKLFALALPHVGAAIQPSLRRSSAALLESARFFRKAVRRICSTSSKCELFSALTETIAEHFKDAEMVGVFRRIETGQWDYPTVLENGRLEERIPELHFQMRRGLTPAQIDETMLHGKLTAPGDVGEWRSSLRTPFVKDQIASASAAAGMDHADCLIARVASDDGTEAAIFVTSYKTGVKVFDEFDRALLGVIADVGSLAMKS